MYPVSYEVDYVEPRSRASTFFRIILAIPLMIVAYVYQIAYFFIWVIAWFAVVITGKYPESLYNAIAWITRYIARMGGYLYLLTDAYPSFTGDDDPNYPLRMQFTRLESYSRLKAGFRLILAIPVMVMSYVAGIVAELIAIVSWFAIVFTGKQPRSLQDMIFWGVRYQTLAGVYIALLTETYPSISAESPGAGSVAPPPPPPPPPAP